MSVFSGHQEMEALDTVNFRSKATHTTIDRVSKKAVKGRLVTLKDGTKIVVVGSITGAYFLDPSNPRLTQL